jgi:hypothetical protein
MEPTMASKWWLELLKEIAPQRQPCRFLVQTGDGAISRLLPESPQNERERRSTRSATAIGGTPRRSYSDI